MEKLSVIAFNILREIKKDKFNISSITRNALENRDKNQIILRTAKLEKDLLLTFNVNASNGIATTFSPSGVKMRTGSYYAVNILFEDIEKYLPPDILSLAYSQQITFFQEAINQTEVKVSCNCGAWYYQGMSEEMKKEANFKGFKGTPGTGYWASLHNTKNAVCKHIYAVIQDMNNQIPKIIKKLNG